MLALTALIKKKQEMEEKGKEETREALYKFTLSPYFVRKVNGISISSPDAKAFKLQDKV